jgi:hypothetical protein
VRDPSINPLSAVNWTILRQSHEPSTEPLRFPFRCPRRVEVGGPDAKQSQMWFYAVETWRGGVPDRLIRRHRACGQQVGHGLNGGPAEGVLITVSSGGIPIYLIMPTTIGGDRVDELWSDDFEVLHWVVERFERNGHSVEVGEALRASFPRSTTTVFETHCVV